MEYFTLNNGVRMPALGYGVFRVEEQDCERCVSDALEVGYRMIDTAAAYGNEAAVGRALRASGIARRELFITTKLKANGPDPMTREAFLRSLDELGLDYVDLYLIHQPYGNVFGCYDEMERLLEEGLVRAVGVSNFTNCALMDVVMNHRIKPAVNQIEISPVNQKASEVAFMKEGQIQPMAWGPLSQGGKGGMFESEILREIAEKHGKTMAQAALRWHIQRGVVAIPKSSRKERMQENFDIFDFALTEEEMERMAGMEKGNFDDPHEDPAFVRMLCGKWDLNGYREKRGGNANESDQRIASCTPEVQKGTI